MSDQQNTIPKISGDPWADYQSWIAAGKPFAFGKELIKKYTRNAKLIRFFHGRKESEKDLKYMEMNLKAIFSKWKK